MVGHRLFYSAVLMFFVLFSGSVSAGKPVDETLKREILETFAEYQGEAISGSKHLTRFFSEEANETWLSWLLEKKSTEKLLVTQRAICNSISFGVEIRDVSEYEVSRGEKGGMVLRIIYKMTPEKFATYEISYIKQSGRWVMSLIYSDSTRPGKNYSGKEIENFPQSVLDEPLANKSSK